MLKSVGAKYTLVGHSDNRGEGDTDTMLKDKVRYALKNNLKVVFCIGENKTEKKNKKTLLSKPDLSGWVFNAIFFAILRSLSSKL